VESIPIREIWGLSQRNLSEKINFIVHENTNKNAKNKRTKSLFSKAQLTALCKYLPL
jgi:hypothetical protein